MLGIILAILAVFTIAQLLVLGTMGGIGPLGFIRKNRIAKAFGNRAAYNFDAIAPIKDNPF